MRFTYRITREPGGYVAECVETDAAGEGKTVEAAVACLRTSLEERMFRPDAVAPPEAAARAPIELVPAPDDGPVSADATADDGQVSRP
jgi:hypothetical protein